MFKETTKWIRSHYSKIVNSIAFYPAIIAVGFLVLSYVMLKIDFSEWGKEFKSQLSWLSLKDASTARSIISTIAGAIISLAVFSFSMVMIVLNQAASQMSNRMLSSMIENRFQQIVLGFYIGAVVYALFLLSTIRDINSGIYVPALSIYLLIILTVVDIFLFIYFLDYVTQTVKYETVIHRVQSRTMETMKKSFCVTEEKNVEWDKELPVVEISTPKSGYFQGFNETQLLKIVAKENISLSFLHKRGTYLIKGSSILLVYGKEKINEDLREELFLSIDIFNGQPIDRNPDYGFRHLAEVAIKALSPGINDPATAVIALNALADLFAFRMFKSPPSVFKDESGNPRIKMQVQDFEKLFGHCIQPIWNYGKSDIYIQKAILDLTDQLQNLDSENIHAAVFNKLKRKIELVASDG